MLQFTPVQMDRLQEELIAYQLLEMSEILDAIWKEAVIFEEGTEWQKNNTTEWM